MILFAGASVAGADILSAMEEGDAGMRGHGRVCMGIRMGMRMGMRMGTDMIMGMGMVVSMGMGMGVETDADVGIEMNMPIPCRWKTWPRRV